MRSDCGCWIKIFNDETKEQGSDYEIQTGKSSWSKGRLDGIKEVYLFDGLVMASLAVTDTDWYQFDRYITTVAVGKNKPTKVHRVVQAQIKEHHVGNYFICKISKDNTLWACISEDGSCYELKKKIIKEDIGRWVSVVLRRHKQPFATLSDKGKI